MLLLCVVRPLQRQLAAQRIAGELGESARPGGRTRSRAALAIFSCGRGRSRSTSARQNASSPNRVGQHADVRLLAHLARCAAGPSACMRSSSLSSQASASGRK